MTTLVGFFNKSVIDGFDSDSETDESAETSSCISGSAHGGVSGPDVAAGVLNDSPNIGGGGIIRSFS